MKTSSYFHCNYESSFVQTENQVIPLTMMLQDNYSKSTKSVAIVGSGPAALMAADVVSRQGIPVTLFEKRKAPGRKLLIAGSSGLNITNSLPPDEFYKFYSGPSKLWQSLFKDFSPKDWIKWIEAMKMETFEGTSGRYFVREMKASKLLRAWMTRLGEQGVIFQPSFECEDFSVSETSSSVQLRFTQERSFNFDAVCFCLGGGSYEPDEKPLRWPSFFTKKDLKFTPFSPSNVGYQVKWPENFLKEADGLPIKNIALTSSRGTRRGEIIITKYGLEGTPVYFSGETGKVFLDLKPDLSTQQILKKCLALKENLAPIRRVNKQLNLCPAARSLLFHLSPKEALKDLSTLVNLLKNFPLHFLDPQPLEESISARGGLDLAELNSDFMLTQFPGVFAAGEMLDWDAPTGGFLIQACVSQGYRAGQSILRYLSKSKRT